MVRTIIAAVLAFIAISNQFLWAHGDYRHSQADLIIFSYDRPLQLYALLESVDRYMQSLDAVHVIYRCSNDQYEQAYAEVWQEFPHVVGYQQSTHPEQDFKPLTMQALHACRNDYVLFAVDDMIVKSNIDCADCIAVLEQYGAYGFFLRMGKNLNACYSMRSSQPLPYFEVDNEELCLWRFSHGIHDWNYPHTVDMTLYRRDMVIDALSKFHFRHPTQLEGAWSTDGWLVADQLGACFAESKVVNLPLNLVQHVMNNRHMDFMSCAELLEVFKQHKKIDIEPLYNIDNKSAHMEYVPTFISREGSFA